MNCISVSGNACVVGNGRNGGPGNVGGSTNRRDERTDRHTAKTLHKSESPAPEKIYKKEGKIVKNLCSLAS